MCPLYSSSSVLTLVGHEHTVCLEAIRDNFVEYKYMMLICIAGHTSEIIFSSLKVILFGL